MITCKRIRKKLSACLDGELPPTEARRIREHLASCPACSREARALAATYQLLEHCPPALRAAAHSAGAPTRPSRRRAPTLPGGLSGLSLRRAGSLLPIVTGLLTGAVLGMWLWPRISPPVSASPIPASRPLVSPRDVETFGALAHDPLEQVYVTLTAPARR